MTARAVAVQGVGSPPLAVAVQGFRGALLLAPLLAIHILASARSFTTAGTVRRFMVPAEVRGVLMLADPTPPDAVFGGNIFIPDELRFVRVSDEVRHILIPA